MTTGGWSNISNAPTLAATQGTMVPNILFEPHLKVDLGKVETSVDEMSMRLGEHYEIVEECSEMQKLQMFEMAASIKQQTVALLKIEDAITKINLQPEVSATHVTVGFHWMAILWMSLAPPLCAVAAYFAVKYL